MDSKSRMAVVVGATILMLLGSHPANAQQTVTSTITNVRVRPGVVYFRLSACPNYARIYLIDDYAKAMFASALAAAAAGTLVQVQFTEVTGCQAGEPTVLYLDLIYPQ